MTRNDDFVSKLEAYLEEYEGSTPLPDHVRGAIRAQLPVINQRPAWWPTRRFPEMNTFAKFGLAAAAMAVAVLLGYNYLVAPNIGGPSLGDPSPIPESTPTPTPPLLSGESLEPGTYRVGLPFSLTATITVPDGWDNVQGYGVGSASSNAVIVFWPSDAEVARVYADPCQWEDGVVDPPVGPTVDDLATALANQPQRGDAVPTDVTVDGYDGKMIELTVPADVNFADCDRGQFRSWDGRFHQAPGQIDRIYILDVGGQRLTIDAHFPPGTSEAALAEQQAVFDSIQIETP
jgi:hypothetical protein